MYDLIIKGGHVIDPENGINGSRDVAVDGGLIAAVEHDIPAEHGRKVARVHGHYVTPGLLDIHMHAYGGYQGWVFPDAHVLPNGVTTVLDTGGAGWKKFEALQGHGHRRIRYPRAGADQHRRRRHGRRRGAGRFGDGPGTLRGHDQRGTRSTSSGPRPPISAVRAGRRWTAPSRRPGEAAPSP